MPHRKHPCPRVATLEIDHAVLLAVQVKAAILAPAFSVNIHSDLIGWISWWKFFPQLSPEKNSARDTHIAITRLFLQQQLKIQPRTSCSTGSPASGARFHDVQSLYSYRIRLVWSFPVSSVVSGADSERILKARSAVPKGSSRGQPQFTYHVSVLHSRFFICEHCRERFESTHTP